MGISDIYLCLCYFYAFLKTIVLAKNSRGSQTILIGAHFITLRLYVLLIVFIVDEFESLCFQWRASRDHCCSLFTSDCCKIKVNSVTPALVNHSRNLFTLGCQSVRSDQEVNLFTT